MQTFLWILDGHDYTDSLYQTPLPLVQFDPSQKSRLMALEFSRPTFAQPQLSRAKEKLTVTKMD